MVCFRVRVRGRRPHNEKRDTNTTSRDTRVKCAPPSPFIDYCSQTRGVAAAAAPPGCSSLSLSLLLDGAAAMLLLLAPERLIS